MLDFPIFGFPVLGRIRSRDLFSIFGIVHEVREFVIKLSLTTRPQFDCKRSIHVPFQERLSHNFEEIV